MSYIDDLNQAASEALAASASATESSQIIYDVANGDENTTVTTANGEVKTLAKAIADITAELKDGAFSTVTEEVVLADGQTDVTLTSATTNGMQLYVEGIREFDFTITSESSFSLSEALPEGTRLWVVGVEFGQDASTSSVTDSSAGTTRTLGGWAGGIQYTYANVSEMSADPDLKIGSKVATVGRDNIFDGGGNDYVIVADGTGTDDGGSYIGLSASGLQAQGVFTRGIYLQQFGASSSGTSDSSGAIIAALNYAGYANSVMTGHREKITVSGGGGRYLVSSPLDITNITNVRLIDAAFTADDTATWAANSAIMEIGALARFNVFDGISLDCNKVTNGYSFSTSGNYQNTIDNGYIFHYVDFGILYEGNSNINMVQNTLLEQVLSGDDDSEDESQYTGIGIWIQSNDVKIHGVTSSKCKYPILFDGCGYCLVSGSHFWNGPGGLPTPWSNESVSVKFSNGAGNNSISGCYIDNGYVEVDSSTGINTVSNSVFLLANSKVPVNAGLVNMIALEDNADLPGITLSSNSLPVYASGSVFVYDQSEHSFQGAPDELAIADYPSVISQRRGMVIQSQLSETLRLQSGSGNARISFASPVASETPPEIGNTGLGLQFRTKSKNRMEISGDGEFAFYDADSGDTLLALSSGGTEWIAKRNGQIGVAMGAGGEDRVLVSTTVIRPVTDNLMNNGNGQFRWSQVFANTSTIGTSDEREKTEFVSHSDAEKRVAATLRESIGKYKWLHSISEKGDSARWHFGLGAQTVKAAFEAEGLDGFEYGLLCYDEWEEDGVAVGRYGLRAEEVLYFIVASL